MEPAPTGKITPTTAWLALGSNTLLWTFMISRGSLWPFPGPILAMQGLNQQDLPRIIMCDSRGESILHGVFRLCLFNKINMIYSMSSLIYINNHARWTSKNNSLHTCWFQNIWKKNNKKIIMLRKEISDCVVGSTAILICPMVYWYNIYRAHVFIRGVCTYFHCLISSESYKNSRVYMTWRY